MDNSFGFGNHVFTHIEGTERGARSIAKGLANELYPNLEPISEPVENRHALRKTVERSGSHTILICENELKIASGILKPYYIKDSGEK